MYDLRPWTSTIILLHAYLSPMNKFFLFFVLLLLMTSSMIAQQLPREFRGVWIATVKNIDWPSRAGLSVEAQQAELIAMLDARKAEGFNAIILQIRPGGDAFYDSPYDPWSEWLTGTEGQAPNPFYDPLTFAVEACHARGMEFHAWFNPFRASLDWDSSKVHAADHLIQSQPDWLLKYGKNLYIDPGIPMARNHVVKIVLDVVKRYDIDAVHFDDYFYPYRVDTLSFPDTTSFATYGGDFEDIGRWRRQNINTFIERLHDSLQLVRPYVQFGISPFGVWRNKSMDAKGSDSRAGLTSYDDLFADIRLWLAEGWIDYVVPQVYFSIGYPPAAYEKLVDWWSQNSYGKNLYIGHSPYKIANNHDKNWDSPKQIPSQIKLARRYDEVQGSVYFSSKWLDKNPLGITDSLMRNYYRSAALPPSLPWLDARPPLPPVAAQISGAKGGLELSWDAALASPDQRYYIVYRSSGRELAQVRAEHFHAIIWGNPDQWIDTDTKRFKKYSYVITAVDQARNESEGGGVLMKRRWR